MTEQEYFNAKCVERLEHVMECHTLLLASDVLVKEDVLALKRLADKMYLDIKTSLEIE